MGRPTSFSCGKEMIFRVQVYRGEADFKRVFYRLFLYIMVTMKSIERSY